jgi:hypothetical protein
MKRINKHVGLRLYVSETEGRYTTILSRETVISRNALDWLLQSQEAVVVIE